jgi:hypothetical protein
MEAVNIGSTIEAVSNNYFYCVYYEAAAAGAGDNGILRLQKSADGTSWTTISSSTTSSINGSLFMKIFIYSASHGFSEIYKI